MISLRTTLFGGAFMLAAQLSAAQGFIKIEVCIEGERHPLSWQPEFDALKTFEEHFIREGLEQGIQFMLNCQSFSYRVSLTYASFGERLYSKLQNPGKHLSSPGGGYSAVVLDENDAVLFVARRDAVVFDSERERTARAAAKTLSEYIRLPIHSVPPGVRIKKRP